MDCGESHDSEVVAVESFSTFGDDETLDDITAEAEGECTKTFTEYAASLPPDSRVVLRVYHRSTPHRPARNPFRERQWDLACVAWSADGRLSRLNTSAPHLHTASGRSLMPDVVAGR